MKSTNMLHFFYLKINVKLLNWGDYYKKGNFKIIILEFSFKKFLHAFKKINETKHDPSAKRIPMFYLLSITFLTQEWGKGERSKVVDNCSQMKTRQENKVSLEVCCKYINLKYSFLGSILQKLTRTSCSNYKR